ncbi:unnamed protein product [Nesidiocoris tenuis]|uniref:Microsomal glutathione S-transferase 1 n=2 Tax=Nesidiocoris tenuis TaxID=355587 RepID=A0A6H5G1E3_9HEMI|nr:Microsomal glutathione [Nesidiocoris tenuis]CAA9995468.1 unnamed protein product [Nesidiocoris tenuis]
MAKTAIETLITLDNPVFKAYLFYNAILVAKMLSMSFLTARQRVAKGVFPNPEDIVLSPKSKIKVDEDVERVRRAHQNDLENITVYMVAAFGFVLTNPSPWLAINLFRAFTFARIAHTLVYAVVVVPQPARAIAFFVGTSVTIYMVAVSLKAFY